MTRIKRGRKKKRGPKKRLPPKIYKGRPTWDYKVISCRNMRQNGYYGVYNDVKQAYDKINQLLAESSKVIFPKTVVNTKNKDACEDEYLILKREAEKTSPALLRNEYGKLVEHKTNTEKWAIFDKFKYHVEETFWVYGYDPRYGRKTFTWIYTELIAGNVKSKYDIKRVFVYKNKIIIKNDSAGMDIVFCKTKSEAIKFYNMLCDIVKRDNLAYVFFGGAFGGKSAGTTMIINDICNYTGWDRKKVTRDTLK